MLIVSPNAAVAAKRAHKSFHGILPEGSGSWVTNHMGRDRKTQPAEAIFPMAHLVEQDPNTHLRPHFHEADQFQVVVAGGGTLGRHPIGPISVHYTNAYTPYGPIEAGSDGVHYFTLRNSWDSGAKYMPESRPQLISRSRSPRTVVAGPVNVRSDLELCKGTDILWENVIDPLADGLGAWLASVPGGRELVGPVPGSGYGQFWLVLRGEAVANQVQLDQNSCIFVSHQEPPLSVLAGSRGTVVFIVQFPRHSPE